jgi:lysophospholipid hydrolase
MSEQGFLSRADLLGGRLSTDRRATRVLGTIEARVSHMRAETKLAVQALFSGREADFTRTFGDDYLRSLRLSARTAEPPRTKDIERFANQWKALVPRVPDVRAAVVQALITRYQLSPGATPASLAAAGAGEPEVQQAYARIFGRPLDESAFSEAPARVEARSPALEEDPERAALAQAEESLEWISAPAGTVLIRQGDQPDFLYFIVSGRLRVTAGSDADLRVVAEVRRGEFVGEIGVLTGEARTATVTAMRDSEVVRLPQADVLRMAYRSPSMLMRMNRVLATRLRAEMSPERKRGAAQMTIALVALDGGVGVRELAAALVEALKPLGAVAWVNRERAEREFPQIAAGVDPSEDGELLAWLTEQEAGNQFVVFEADAELNQWTDLCIRQADRIALAAAASGNPAKAPVEERIAELNPTARMELVLLHPAGSEPRETRRWLQFRQVAAHHHVVVGDRALVARLGRRLAGQAVGLVLGGGGARGYAHIGAWRAIEEAGLPVDMIGGTSVGSIIAGEMATDRDADEMEALGRLFAQTKLTDLTLPIVSFFRSKALTSLLHKHGKGRRIEDLWRPFFCVSTSLTKGEPVIHRSGPLWKATRASTAIPGLFSPVTSADGDLLVDGAIMNNVPVDVMRAMCEQGPVIAIDLTPTIVRSDAYAFGPDVSGWQVLWSKVNPFAQTVEVPSIFSTLLRTTEAGSAHRTRTGEVLAMADLVIRPPMDHRGLLDFGSMDEFMKRGYEATAAALETWLEENPEIDQKLRPKRL